MTEKIRLSDLERARSTEAFAKLRQEVFAMSDADLVQLLRSRPVPGDFVRHRMGEVFGRV